MCLTFHSGHSQAFANGFDGFAHHFMDPDFVHAVKLTLMLAAVAVPVNTLFGVVAAINITRNEFPGKVWFFGDGRGQIGN